MSSSDEDDRHYQEDDEDTLCKYGTQLLQYEADEIPSKKPLQVEDMVVKDENGRRRFHGAFTGGFSAGYWNTVGSKEGFTPAEFKSSRSEKATAKAFKPTDFMDDEDLGEFGIAPMKIQTTEDFGTASSTAKRKRERPSEGPIPGEPVLKNLLKPVHDKAAVRILKSMGWRDGQGIGSRMTYSEKKRAAERNKREMYVSKKYGNDSSEDDLSDDEITFVPDDFDPFIAKIKDNSFGLEYSGLKPSSSTSSSSHINLFEPFQVFSKNNKKFSISGQAFGVGALEEPDDDIYAIDDMSNYDRTLESEKFSKARISKPLDASIIEGFSRATIRDTTVRVHNVDVPRDYEPRNWLQRKSRFQPISKDKAKELEIQSRHKTLGLGRHDLKPEERGALLNDKPSKSAEHDVIRKDDDEEKKKKSQEASRKMLELLNSKQFESEHSKKNEIFKPFIINPEKQERYEKFLDLKTSDPAEIDKFFNDIQPLSMKAFDREMEKKEFIQARRMYQPLDSLIGSRFIKEVDIQKEPEVKKVIKDGNEVIVIQRTKVMWKPNKNLCKLFNIPEPYGGIMFDEQAEEKKKKQSSSLFDYIGVPLNTKANFVTPQVIPRKLSENSGKKSAEEERRKTFLAAIEKEKSFMGNRVTAKDFFNTPETVAVTVEQSKSGKGQEVSKREVNKIVQEPPKTELEKKVAESIHKKPEEKKDLFKAIFCDSDDDEDENGSSQDTTEAIKVSNTDGSSSLTDKQKSTFIESFLSTKNASEINVLRNKSPPRGIFKSIFELGTSKFAVNEKKPEDVVVNSESMEEELYGPALPTNLSVPFNSNKNDSEDESSTSSDSSLDEKLLKKLKKTKSSRKDEEWVEKDKLKKSKKHHKKKKSHKKSHKKHKSKK